MGKIIGCKYNDGGVIIIGQRKGKAKDVHRSIPEKEKHPLIRKDQPVIIDTFGSSAIFYVDKSCFDDGEIPANGVNWSIVYQEAFANAIGKKTKDDKIDSKL